MVCMIELLGIAIALTIGPAVANGFLETAATLDDLRWASISALLNLGEGSGT